MGQTAAQDQGISALYIVMPSFPLEIVLYKYLQGNDINEGRELFAVSKDGRIPNSILKLWKEIFRLDHTRQKGKGRWRLPGRRISLVRTNKQGGSREQSPCLDLDAATHEALPRLNLTQQTAFLTQLLREARSESPQVGPEPLGNSSSLHSPRIGGVGPPSSCYGEAWGWQAQVLLPSVARALPEDFCPIFQKTQLPTTFFQLPNCTSSILCLASTQACFSCHRAGGFRPCQCLGIGIN